MISVENVGVIHDLISAALKHYEAPLHVAHRIGVLVPEPSGIQFVDAVAREDRGVKAGELYMFTSDMVIHSAWECPAWEDSVPRHSGVTVEVWPRRDLKAVAIQPGSDVSVNTDGDWKSSIGQGWPGSGRVTLKYADRTAVVLPLSDRVRISADHVGEFIPKLVADLSLRTIM